jgi:nitroimidazol reductase NimA-like FMN-containing flavoprotein (pyridoxamine 5'-phosphate oxidase superfamily)
MDNKEQARRILGDLFNSQLQAVLATDNQQQPYTSLMAFVAKADLTQLLFATYRDTHKYKNLESNPRAALLIDNRTCQLTDHYEGAAVTAIGQAHEISAAERDEFLRLFLARHPNLAAFVNSPDCALMAMRVEHYYIVSQFQQVVDWVM